MYRTIMYQENEIVLNSLKTIGTTRTQAADLKMLNFPVWNLRIDYRTNPCKNTSQRQYIKFKKKVDSWI